MKLVNMGCSFAYGNQAGKYGHLCGLHKNSVTFLAEWLDVDELNLARPGNSNEGILDNILHWISTTTQEQRQDSILIIGWTSGLRFGFVSDIVQASNKERLAKQSSPEASMAFVLGPQNLYRYKIDKWNLRWEDQMINLRETAVLSLYRSVIAAQSVASHYGLRMLHYHGLDPRWSTKDGDDYRVNSDIRHLIDTEDFYGFEQHSLQDVANSNPMKYHIADDDSHPNHVCYERWAREMLPFVKSRLQL